MSRAAHRRLCSVPIRGLQRKSGSDEGVHVKKLAAAVTLCVTVLVGGLASSASARTEAAASGAAHLSAPPINWGVADDMSKYADDGGAWFYGQLAGANLKENRWTLSWNPSDPTAITVLPFFER